MTFLNLRSIASGSAMQGVDMFGKRVGFLKFKADIVDEETKTKVIAWNVAATVLLSCGHLGITIMVWAVQIVLSEFD